MQHYEQDADGLCTQLTKSLPKKGKQFCVDPNAFVAAGWVIQNHDLEVSNSSTMTVIKKLEKQFNKLNLKIF